MNQTRELIKTTLFLKRDRINQKLRAAGIPGHIVCRKGFPFKFGLAGDTESNIIFDESDRNKPIALCVLGWLQEADKKLENFIRNWKIRN